MIKRRPTNFGLKFRQPSQYCHFTIGSSLLLEHSILLDGLKRFVDSTNLRFATVPQQLVDVLLSSIIGHHVTSSKP